MLTNNEIAEQVKLRFERIANSLDIFDSKWMLTDDGMTVQEIISLKAPRNAKVIMLNHAASLHYARYANDGNAEPKLVFNLYTDWCNHRKWDLSALREAPDGHTASIVACVVEIISSLVHATYYQSNQLYIAVSKAILGESSPTKSSTKWELRYGKRTLRTAAKIALRSPQLQIYGSFIESLGD